MDGRIRVWLCHFPDRPALQLQWVDPATGRKRTRSSGTADESQAEARRADLEYELNHGLAQVGQRCSWQAFRQAFQVEYLAGRCQNTRLNFLSALDSLEALCRPATLEGVTARVLSQWVALCRESLAESTIAVRLDYLRSAMGWAVRQGLLPKIPAVPKLRRPEAEPRPVPAEQFEQLLAAAPDARVRLYLLLGWEAGLRRAEAVALSWEASERVPWVDMERNRVVFPAAGNKGRRACWVPLSARLREALGNRSGVDCRVFPGWTNSSANGLFSRLAARAGVRLTMKALRRGFVCRYAASVPAQVLQRLARHGNISVTMKYYASVDEAVERAVNAASNSPPRKAV